jgi:hypothetical protein
VRQEHVAQLLQEHVAQLQQPPLEPPQSLRRVFVLIQKTQLPSVNQINDCGFYRKKKHSSQA